MSSLKVISLIFFAFVLAACGGGGGSGSDSSGTPVSGSISGLTGILTLDFNGNRVTASSDGDITFGHLETGLNYSISVISQPEGQFCQIENGTGVVVEGGVDSVQISCDAITQIISGNVTGLNGELELQLSSGVIREQLTVTDSTFSFASQLAFGNNYSVSVSQQPFAQTCSVSNAVGSIETEAPTQVSVTCIDSGFGINIQADGLINVASLELVSGTTTEQISVDSGQYSFDTVLSIGDSYSVNLLSSPAGQECILLNSSGTVTSNGTTTVTLSCGNLDYGLSGTVSGLTGTLELSLTTPDGTELLSVDGATFSFLNRVSLGDAYEVSIAEQPNEQLCTLNNASGTAVGNALETIEVSCLTAIHRIGGTVSGLAGTLTLSLQSGEASELLEVTESEFSFEQELEIGDSYLVTVSQQPADQECYVSGGSGQVSESGVTAISIVCLDLIHQVSGTTTGLNGTLGLSLVTSTAQEQLSVTGSSFTFAQRLATGAEYSVEISAQPDDQVCNLTNASGTATDEGTTLVSASCEDLSGLTASISGTISYAASTRVDSDTNDPFSPIEDNSTFANAQAIPNIVTVQGFATAEATGGVGDNFESSTDVDDYYRVSLQQGQGVRLQVVDHSIFETQGTYQGDLDLYLFDENMQLVTYSINTTEFEELSISLDGDYFVNVTAFEGSSKYVLSVSSTANPSAVNPSADFVPNEALIKMSDRVSVRSNATPTGIQSLRHTDLSRANLAKLNPASVVATNTSKTVAKTGTLEALNPDSYQKVMTIKQIKQLSQQSQVEFAEPNYRVHAFRTPNDEYYHLQWHYPNMKLPQAWDITTGSPGAGEEDVIVAVVDTGVFLTHPDLSGQLVTGYDFISDPSIAADGDGIDSNPDDPGDSASPGSSSWHGTHVAGTVAANSNNGIGVAGVSWGAKVMPLRALGVDGGTSYDVLQSVRYAAGLSNDSGTTPSRAADIINLSLGGGPFSNIESQLFQQVYDMGIIVIAAAGNESTSSPSYPASYDGVISVSALDSEDQLAPYSNFGSNIDIAAPGGDLSDDDTGDGYPDGVLSTLLNDSSGERQPNFTFYQGTSMAAPHVAGMAALMKAVHPDLDAAAFEALLLGGSLTDDAGQAGRDNSYGHGIANALKAVQAAQSLANGGEQVEIPASIVASASNVNFGATDSAEVTITNQGGGTPTVSSIETSDAWVNVVANEVDEAGLGSYSLSVIREGLNDGLYVGSITFNFDGANPTIISVSMTVGTINTDGGLAKLFTLVIDPDTNVVVAQNPAVDNGDGTASFSVPGVSAGNYIVIAGTDIDNDLVICQAGEACGAYPTLADSIVIQVNGSDVSDIDFTSDIISGFGVVEGSSVMYQRPPSEVPEKELPKLLINAD